MLITRLAGVHRTYAWLAILTVDLQVARRGSRKHLDFERDFFEATIVKLEQNYRSTQIIRRGFRCHQPEPQSQDKHLDRQEGRHAVIYFRGGDELEEADFITRTARTGLPTTSMRWSRSCPAPSRARLKTLMREGSPQDRRRPFLQRKEIGALAYMRLVISPHDDVSCGA